jgi:glycosyltransferase involved in cell wall biosynthesis
MSDPRAGVTVVIPVWDGYIEFVADAVESVRRNAPKAPIVVVDNASSIPVPELEGCQVVRSSRRLSEGSARNLGLDLVNSQFVAFLDADDLLLDAALAYMHGRLTADAGLSVSACSILDGATGERHRNPRQFAARLARWPRAFALVNSIWSLLPIPGSAVLRTDQVRTAGGYADSDLGEDWDLAVSLAWRGRVEISPKLGRYYRATAGSPGRRARSPSELRAIAGRVRARLRSDSAVPHWAKALLPVIALLQLIAIHLARPAFLFLRALRTRRRSNIR